MSRTCFKQTDSHSAMLSATPCFGVLKSKINLMNLLSHARAQLPLLELVIAAGRISSVIHIQIHIQHFFTVGFE